MQAVRHQRLRAPEIARHYLQYGQQQIDKNTDPSAFLRGGKTLGIGRFKSGRLAVGMFVSVIFHRNWDSMLRAAQGSRIAFAARIMNV